jgi:AraC family transcriptional regulator, alkane utilization regulator
MDALSDLLSVIRLGGAAFLHAEFTAPWRVMTPPCAEVGRQLLPRAARIIPYHLVTQGSMWVSVSGLPPTQVTAGQAVLFPHADIHEMSDRSDVPRKLLDIPDGPRGCLLRAGGGGPATKLVCGFFGGDAQVCALLLDTMPRIFKVDFAEQTTTAWLESSMRYAAESWVRGDQGSEIALAKLSELLFIEALRNYLRQVPAERSGWLAALRDPVIGKALTVLHSRCREPWSVDALGREIGLSRSALAARFRELVGIPPMEYLANWRLQRAALSLREGSFNLDRIAEEACFNSVAAFSRAFRRKFGTSPAAWKRATTGNCMPVS